MGFIGGNLGLLVICLLLGMALRASRRLPESTPVALNAFIIHVSLPAVVLLNLNEMSFGDQALYPISMAWLLFGFGALYCLALARVAGWDRKTTGALILTAGLSNTSFVGYPMLEAIFGPEALKVGILTDQPGSFLVVSTVGVAVASSYSSGKTSVREILSRILGFPPFYALILGVLLKDVEFPVPVREALSKLGGTLAPIALFAVGFQIRWSLAELRGNAAFLFTGLVFKLLLGPALLLVVFSHGLGAEGETLAITVAQAAMAPMITGGILAANFGLRPDLASLMISVGTPLSFITVPLWAWVLR